MIQKIVPPGGSFRGVLNYLLGPTKQAVLLDGNLTGTNPRELAAEFGHVRARNPRVAKPVFHASLALPPAETLTEDQWRQAVRAYLEALGYGSSSWVAIQHHDTEHPHVHIVASRIDDHGHRVGDFQERRRGEAQVRELEDLLGLERVASSLGAHRSAPTREDLATFERTGTVTVKAQLQSLLDASLEDRPTLSELLVRLDAQGIQVHANVQSTGRVAGWSFELDGVAMKASALGRGYTLSALQESGRLDYDPDRDLAALRALTPRRSREAAAPGPSMEKELRELLARATEDRPALETLRGRLAAEGVELRLEVDEAGRPATWSLEAEGQAINGRSLGTDQTLAAYEGRGAIAPFLDGRGVPGADSAPGVSPRRFEERLRSCLHQALEGAPTFGAVAERLRSEGIEIQASRDASGRVQSWSFLVEGRTVPSERLGGEFGFDALVASKSLDYDPARDHWALDVLPGSPEPSVVSRLRQALCDALDASARLDRVVQRLSSEGIDVRPHFGADRRLIGWHFEVEGRHVEASALGRDFTFAALRDAGRLDHVPQRDSWVYDPQLRASFEASALTTTLAPAEGSDRVPLRSELRETLLRAAGESATVREYAEAVQAAGIELRPRLALSGEVRSLGYHAGGEFFPARSIDPSLTWRELQRVHRIDYQVDRDLPMLRDHLDRFRIGQEDPGSPPRHRYIPNLTNLYKEAARLSALLRHDERHARHSAARALLETAIQQARGHLDEVSRLSSQAGRLQQAFEQDLRLAFEPRDHSRVLGAAQRLVRSQGHARACETLLERPEDLGRLRGSSLGPVETTERIRARAHLHRASGSLYELGAVRRGIATAQTRTADASLALQRLQGQAAAHERSLRRLAETGHRLGRALSKNLALTFAPAPLRSALIVGESFSRAAAAGSLAPVQRMLLHAALPRPLQSARRVLRAGAVGGGGEAVARGLSLLLPAGPRALLSAALAMSRDRSR